MKRLNFLSLITLLLLKNLVLCGQQNVLPSEISPDSANMLLTVHDSMPESEPGDTISTQIRSALTDTTISTIQDSIPLRIDKMDTIPTALKIPKSDQEATLPAKRIPKAQLKSYRSEYETLRTNEAKYDEHFLKLNRILQQADPNDKRLQAEYLNYRGLRCEAAHMPDSTLYYYLRSYNVYAHSAKRKAAITRVLTATVDQLYQKKDYNKIARLAVEWKNFQPDNTAFHYQVAWAFFKLDKTAQAKDQLASGGILLLDQLTPELTQIWLDLQFHEYINACINSREICITTDQPSQMNISLSYYLTGIKALYLFPVMNICAAVDNQDYASISNAISKYAPSVTGMWIKNKGSEWITIQGNDDLLEKFRDKPYYNDQCIDMQHHDTIVLFQSTGDIQVLLTFTPGKGNREENLMINDISTRRKMSAPWIQYEDLIQDNYLRLIAIISSTALSNGNIDTLSKTLNLLMKNDLVRYFTVYDKSGEPDWGNSFDISEFDIDQTNWEETQKVNILLKREIRHKENQADVIVDICVPVYKQKIKTGVLRIGINKIWN